VFSKFLRLFNTIKFLKPKQLNYRLYYFVRSKFRKAVGIKPLLYIESHSYPLELQNSIHIIDCYLGNNSFCFLNLSKRFEKEIDWNCVDYGKLWTYNLTYFDFLSQNYKDSLFLIENFIDNIDTIKDGLEPFPISLRGINWIKYLSYHKIKNQKIDNSLYAQYYILLDNLEYHLLGNHLLENGFSLLYGAYYFQDEKLYHKSKEIILEQLEEQILEDGGHFELSPMYHQIMLFRVLDCINLVKNNNWKDKELLEFLTIKAQKMLGWLKDISYKNGDIPLLNDSTNGIAPTTEQLFAYSKNLKLNITNLKLSDSGYRKITKGKYECIIDIGDIGAEYIAGHAHADTFNFELRINNKPFIVDTGLSTYETCNRRDKERSTQAHNTVEIDGRNQSDVWGGFRVANRARVIDIKEGNNFIEATHNGYGKVLHSRKWIFKNDRVIVEDRLNGNSYGIARLHFHPNVSKSDIVKYIPCILNTDYSYSIYQFSSEFNKNINSKIISIKFQKTLKIEILSVDS